MGTHPRFFTQPGRTTRSHCKAQLAVRSKSTTLKMLLRTDTPTQTVIADKAYDAQARLIELLLAKDKVVVIPLRATNRRCSEYDRNLYKAQHLIGNFFARIKQYRSIATRYDKTTRNFLGAIHLAASVVRRT